MKSSYFCGRKNMVEINSPSFHWLRISPKFDRIVHMGLYNGWNSYGISTAQRKKFIGRFFWMGFIIGKSMEIIGISSNKHRDLLVKDMGYLNI
jgi:hypothetical protein